MKTQEEKTGLVAKFWHFLSLNFTTEGGGIGAFLTLFLIMIVFAIAISFIFRNILFVAIPFLVVMLYLMHRFIDRFFGLAEKSNTQKLFFTPDQRMNALKLEYKYGSDKKALETVKPSTKFTQPIFEEGVIIPETKK